MCDEFPCVSKGHRTLAIRLAKATATCLEQVAITVLECPDTVGSRWFRREQCQDTHVPRATGEGGRSRATRSSHSQIVGSRGALGRDSIGKVLDSRTDRRFVLHQLELQSLRAGEEGNAPSPRQFDDF